MIEKGDVTAVVPDRHGSDTSPLTPIRVLVALAWLLLSAGLVLLILTPPVDPPLLLASAWQDVLLVLAIGLYPLVGAMILSRRPRHRVGWVFLTSGCLLAVWVFAAGYAGFGLVENPGRMIGAAFLGWVYSWIVLPGFFTACIFLPLLFPDGVVGGRWQRVAAGYGGVALVFATAAWATSPEPTEALPLRSEYYSVDLVGRLQLDEVGFGLTVLAVLGSVVSMVVRYRRSEGVERRQLQWFVFAAVLIATVWIALSIGSDWPPAAVAAELMFPVAVAGLPVAAFVAIFKYDLYDIELVISKTLTVGILLAFISGVYVMLVAGIGSLVGVAGGSSVAIAVVATALVAVAFSPLRTGAQRMARRFVYGERADPYEVLAEFSHRMGSAPDPSATLEEIAKLVEAGTGAEVTEVYLAVGEELRLMASTSATAGRRTVPLVDTTLPEISGATHTVEVAHQGRLLGAISWKLGVGQSSKPTEQRLVSDLAAQAALVFENLRLIEELKASRQRLVSAQDRERRRLERDLHDGVQQRLLALAMALGSEDGEAHPDVAAGAAEEARAILAELRRLARGIHPAIVAEGGLDAALESLAERSPIPVALDVEEVEGLPLSVEITLYYFAAEGLTNATRHAAASQVEIAVRANGGAVEMTVSDDGRGGADWSGSGLVGLADRVAAVGGQMQVGNPPGGGTLLRAVIPCG